MPRLGLYKGPESSGERVLCIRDTSTLYSHKQLDSSTIHPPSSFLLIVPAPPRRQKATVFTRLDTHIPNIAPPASPFRMSGYHSKLDTSQILEILGSPPPTPESTHQRDLKWLLHSHVEELLVEFLAIRVENHKARKPHVVFHFNFRPFSQFQFYKACQLSMEFTADGSSGNGGEMFIKQRNFAVSHMSSTGSFGFSVKDLGKGVTFDFWLRTLLGRHKNPGLRGDLTQYEFAEVENPEGGVNLMDGCRDWISQAFTRFYLAGLVNIFGRDLKETPALYEGHEVTYLNFEETVPKRAKLGDDPFWFPDVIDKRFMMTPSTKVPAGVTVQSLPMWRGKFHDDRVIRYETLTIQNSKGESFTFIYSYQGSVQPAVGPLGGGGGSGGGSGGPPPPGGPNHSGGPSLDRRGGNTGGSGGQVSTAGPGLSNAPQLGGGSGGPVRSSNHSSTAGSRGNNGGAGAGDSQMALASKPNTSALNTRDNHDRNHNGSGADGVH